MTSTITRQLFAGDKSRGESLDPLATGIVIEWRNLRQRFRIFPTWKKYQVLPLFDLATEQEKADFEYSVRHWRNWRKQTLGDAGHATRELKITVHYQATAEEQVMFDCIARHWVVRRRDEHDGKFGENWQKPLRMHGISILNSWPPGLLGFRAI